MARFYPIYVRRSDGKTEVVSKGKRKEVNQPTEEQMDQKPDKNGVSDYYRECEINEVKHLDWRRKLGGMLARQLDWKESDCGYILVAFPQNYRLYEHIKKSEKDGNTEVKTKTHAAGGNDRQDAYLYGHPSGRRKRFRSPADFFPHLLWLCTDETGDPEKCSCKICCPEELENLIPGAKTTKLERPVKEEARSMKSATPQPIPMKLENPKSDQKMSTIPRPESLDQRADSQYDSFRYRQGELCWFRRGQAWGLGVIVRRWNTYNSYSYSVQPLSHPNNNQPLVTITSDDDMRPWLAWSVPRFTHAGLNDITPLPQYDTIDWQALAQGRYGSGGDMDVDGSILAAKSIDSSYTPFSPSQKTEVQAGVVDTFYDGIYLGAEKIWKGEPIRLAPGTGLDILVLQHVVERSKHGIPEQIQLIGDVYTLTTIPHADASIPTPASPQNNPNLPQRLTKDLAYRNARSIQLRRVASYWKHISTQTRVDLDSVKGRWYEASLWLPVLQPDAFRVLNEHGDLRELSLYMNSRGDCLQANRDPTLPKIPRMNNRKAARIDAFRQAVPLDTEIVDGLGPTTISAQDLNLDPRSNEVQNTAGNDNNFDQLMNLDGVDNSSGYY